MNLIKQEETGSPKETLLFDEYTNCIRYLNKQLQKQTDETASPITGTMTPTRTKPIAYITFDFLKCARSPNQNVLDAISEIAGSIFKTTGFFRTLIPLSSTDARLKSNDISLSSFNFGRRKQNAGDNANGNTTVGFHW